MSDADTRLRATLRAVLPSSTRIEPRDGESAWAAACRALECDDAALATRIARHYGIGVAVVGPVDPVLRRLVPEALARRLAVLPLRASESVLTLAAAAPLDPNAERTIAAGSGRRVRVAIAAPSVVVQGIDALYRGAPTPALDRSPAVVARDAADDETRPVVRLVDELIAAGVRAGASDIHLECGDAGVAVRHRVDGVLREPTALGDAGVPVVSRIKILSGLDIADRLRPQDGRARVTVDGRTLDLRVSTLPAAHGEKVVIRVLDARAASLSLDALGLPPSDAAGLETLFGGREGLVLVTGPTGSGKTTTLYAALRQVQRRGVNVVTVEDPVEYRLDGIAQVQVSERAGLTFAAALRSILRQDPDVVLVGEIRDRETAAIAVQAALTGHLVLSTLHTIDAAGAAVRLVDLGVEPFNLAAALRGVVAQRLLRKRCDACAGTRVGCHACAGSGYRGRVAVVERLACDALVCACLARGAPAAEIADAARVGGMRSLWACGLEQVARGATDEAELRRVLEAPPALAAPGPPSSVTRHGALPRLDDTFELV